MGKNECDDGNLMDGDGCNSECKIEKGFQCYKTQDGADFCKDNEFPEAELIVHKNNQLEIYFNEDVISSVNSKIFNIYSKKVMNCLN